MVVKTEETTTITMITEAEGEDKVEEEDEGGKIRVTTLAAVEEEEASPAAEQPAVEQPAAEQRALHQQPRRHATEGG